MGATADDINPVTEVDMYVEKQGESTLYPLGEGWLLAQYSSQSVCGDGHGH